MKNLLLDSVLISMLLFFFSCSLSKNATIKNGEEATIWVKSTLNEPITHHDKNGVYAFACYGITYDEDLKRDQMDYISTEWQPFCGMITNFDYEEGNFYRLKIKQTKKANKKIKWIEDKGNWEVVEVLSKELDRHYERVEECTIWLGPEIVDVRCRGFAPPDCTFKGYQCQRSETLDEDGEWEDWFEHSLIKDYEEGYFHKITYKKFHLSDFEARTIQDHPGYSIGDIKILSKTKVEGVF